MKKPLSKNISLYKELQIIQESPRGIMMIYTCYEAIPNGGFCILSAIPEKDGKIQLKRASFIKKPEGSDSTFPTLFFPTLIDAIKAYSPEEKSSNTAS